MNMFADNNKCYEDRNDFNLHQINGLTIPLNANWKNIGINLSGGADSACLAMILCEIIKKNNYSCKLQILTFIRGWNKKPWQEPISLQVYEKLKNNYPDIIADRHTCYIAPELEYSSAGKIINNKSGDQIIGRSFNRYMQHKLQLYCVYNATSSRPQDETFDREILEKDRHVLFDRNISRPSISNLLTIEENGFIGSTPFKHVDKSWIIAQFFLFDKVSILNATRSCESDVNTHSHWPKLHNYTDKTVVPECGVCFWCKEREWALREKDRVISTLKSEDQ